MIQKRLQPITVKPCGHSEAISLPPRYGSQSGPISPTNLHTNEIVTHLDEAFFSHPLDPPVCGGWLRNTAVDLSLVLTRSRPQQA